MMLDAARRRSPRPANSARAPLAGGTPGQPPVVNGYRSQRWLLADRPSPDVTHSDGRAVARRRGFARGDHAPCNFDAVNLVQTADTQVRAQNER